MTVPTDYVHVYLCVLRKHLQTHIKLHVLHFTLNISAHETKLFTVQKRKQRIPQEASSLTYQEKLLLLSSKGEWGWEDWQRWEICTAIWKEGDNLRHLGADRIIKIRRRILYKYGVTRSNSLYYQPEVNTVIANVYWTVHHCNSWRIIDQLDVTCYFISLLMYSTCFGH